MNLGEVCTEEPAGLGAVVRTADGTWWSRCNHPSTCKGGGHEARWEKSNQKTRHTWDQVVAAGEPILCNRGVNIPPELPEPKAKATRPKGISDAKASLAKLSQAVYSTTITASSALPSSGYAVPKWVPADDQPF